MELLCWKIQAFNNSCRLSEWNVVSRRPSNVPLNYLYHCRGLRVQKWFCQTGSETAWEQRRYLKPHSSEVVEPYPYSAATMGQWSKWRSCLLCVLSSIPYIFSLFALPLIFHVQIYSCPLRCVMWRASPSLWSLHGFIHIFFAEIRGRSVG